MGHHCPVCFKTTHKRCIEKGHLKVCTVHGNICGHHSQCVNCYEERRQTLTPRKAKSIATKKSPTTKRSPTTESKSRSLPGRYAKLKEAFRSYPTIKKLGGTLDDTKDNDKPSEPRQNDVDKTTRPAEQAAKEDPKWNERHLPNTDKVPRQAKPGSRTKGLSMAAERQKTH